LTTDDALYAGAAWKNVDARKTKMAAPVSFSRWFGDAPSRLLRANPDHDAVASCESG
jgi:hypothetical protein